MQLTIVARTSVIAVYQLSSLGEIISMCRSDSSMKFEGSLVVVCDTFLALSFLAKISPDEADYFGSSRSFPIKTL